MSLLGHCAFRDDSFVVIRGLPPDTICLINYIGFTNAHCPDLDIAPSDPIRYLLGPGPENASASGRPGGENSRISEFLDS